MRATRLLRAGLGLLACCATAAQATEPRLTVLWVVTSNGIYSWADPIQTFATLAECDRVRLAWKSPARADNQDLKANGPRRVARHFPMCLPGTVVPGKPRGK